LLSASAKYVIAYRIREAASVTGRRWYSLPRGAVIYGFKQATLRKQLKRNAQQLDDGSTEARVGRVRGRKFGKLWRVSDTTSQAEANSRQPSLADVALSLDLTEPALIRRLQRNAMRTGDDRAEAHIDGVHGRRSAKTWVVSLAKGWTD
jgi:hypothetical protein